MKYFTEFLIIVLISLAGELIHYVVPLPMPASVYGMLILFCALRFGLIKLDQVRDTGKFLIEIMPLMFVPAGVGLMTSVDVLKPIIIPMLIMVVVTLLNVMLAAGRLSQYLIRRRDDNE